MSKDVSKVDQLPLFPLDRLAQLFPRRRSRVSSSSDGAPGETPEARYFAATKELVLTRYTHQNTRMNSEYESYDESTDENIQIIKKDMEGDEKRSSGSSPPKHVCGSILEKLEQTKEQMQQTRKKSSNKVGVEMPSDVDCSWDRPPPCPSARFRVASGASQFREVNFSVAVGGKKDPDDAGDNGDAEKAGTSSEGEKEDSVSRVGEDVEKTVDDKGGRRSETKYEIVPQSLNLASNGALEAEFLRFSSGASTSKCGDPRGCQASLGGSMTEDTELSCGSTRSLGDEERKPPKPPKDDRVRPVLTATSLAIYTNIEQNGSRSGTCLLCTTAVCTFIVTMVLAVGILIAPKTLAVKEPPRRPLPDPPPPEPPALPANASSETPSVAALRGLTITRTQRARQGGGREHASSTLSLATTPPATRGRPPATVSMHLVSPTASATPSSARHTGYTLKFLRRARTRPTEKPILSPEVPFRGHYADGGALLFDFISQNDVSLLILGRHFASVIPSRKPFPALLSRSLPSSFIACRRAHNPLLLLQTNPRPLHRPHAAPYSRPRDIIREKYHSDGVIFIASFRIFLAHHHHPSSYGCGAGEKGISGGRKNFQTPITSPDESFAPRAVDSYLSPLIGS
ncbi:hypothetical protein C7M84_023060 [Penaeus vannamei]|uniref:Uncharacterized protein n=1 Tax=Penaeus vannamei TaxID=6689 RepID=A0A3R7T064_PENVA|nr:hypothetical protein C7M84_023060 [Penaeus vannamei]